ncbi:MAG: hypothetical protein ACLUHE_04120 [Christensenellales bacterium]
MDERCKTDEVLTNPALLDAGLMILAMNRWARNMSVMMPYADSLEADGGLVLPSSGRSRWART